MRESRSELPVDRIVNTTFRIVANRGVVSMTGSMKTNLIVSPNGGAVLS